MSRAGSSARGARPYTVPYQIEKACPCGGAVAHPCFFLRGLSRCCAWTPPTRDNGRPSRAQGFMGGYGVLGLGPGSRLLQLGEDFELFFPSHTKIVEKYFENRSRINRSGTQDPGPCGARSAVRERTGRELPGRPIPTRAADVGRRARCGAAASVSQSPRGRSFAALWTRSTPSGGYPGPTATRVGCETLIFVTSYICR